MVTAPFEALITLGTWWRERGGEWSETDAIHFAAQGDLPR